VITAKVFLSGKEETRYVAAGPTNVKLSFSANHCPENLAWSQATPWVNFQMAVTEAVAEHFVLGGKYTLTFEQEES
jgi:hypothetical protein